MKRPVVLATLVAVLTALLLLGLTDTSASVSHSLELHCLGIQARRIRYAILHILTSFRWRVYSQYRRSIMKLKVILEIKDLEYYGRLDKELLEEFRETGRVYSSDEFKGNAKDEEELERGAISRLNRILSNEGLTVHQIERID